MHRKRGGGAKPLTLTLTLAVTTLSLNLTLTLRTKILTLDRTQIPAQIWWLNYDQLLTGYRPNLTRLYPWSLKWTLRVKFLSNRRGSWTQHSGRWAPIVLAHFDWIKTKNTRSKSTFPPKCRITLMLNLRPSHWLYICRIVALVESKRRKR